MNRLTILFSEISKKRIALAVAVAGLVTASVSGIALYSQPNGLAGAVASADNTLNAFLARSPGERGFVDILKGRAHTPGRSGAVPPPRERALGKVFDSPPEATVSLLDNPPPVDVLVPDFGNPLVPGDIPEPGFIPGPPPGSGPPFINIPGIPGGGPGTPTNPPAVPPTNPPAVPPTNPPAIPPTTPGAVPEPATWALFILGLFAVSVTLRRRKTIGGTAPCGSA